MENNTEVNTRLTFYDLIKNGITNGANIVNEMPWSWKINGKSITHENDNCYIIETIDGHKHFHKGTGIIHVFENGLQIMVNGNELTHAPGGCPM